MHVLRNAAAAALLGLSVSSASAGEWLTGDQIEALISGNTTYGKHEKKDFNAYSYNRPDGTFVGWSSKWGPTKGTWRVKGNRICRHREGGKRENCHDVRDNGDGTYNRYKQPKNLTKPRVHIFTWTKVAEGNAENVE